MTVKEAKEKLQNLVDSLNVYWDDADFDINVHDNGKFNILGFYNSDPDDWVLDTRTGKVVLIIE